MLRVLEVIPLIMLSGVTSDFSVSLHIVFIIRQHSFHIRTNYLNQYNLLAVKMNWTNTPFYVPFDYYRDCHQICKTMLDFISKNEMNIKRYSLALRSVSTENLTRILSRMFYVTCNAILTFVCKKKLNIKRNYVIAVVTRTYISIIILYVQ